MDEGCEIGGQLRIGHGRAEYPLVSLRRDLLCSSRDNDLRRLRLRGDLGSGEARRAADAADEDRYIIARRQSLRDVDSFLGFAGVIRINCFNLFTADATSSVLFLDCEIDGFLLSGTRGSGVASERSEYSNLYRLS
jgi:hypothetical protein